jgi:hypothetical protein
MTSNEPIVDTFEAHHYGGSAVLCYRVGELEVWCEINFTIRWEEEDDGFGESWFEPMVDSIEEQDDAAILVTVDDGDVDVDVMLSPAFLQLESVMETMQELVLEYDRRELHVLAY